MSTQHFPTEVANAIERQPLSAEKKGGLSFFLAWADRAGLHGAYSILMLQKVAHIALQSQSSAWFFASVSRW